MQDGGAYDAADRPRVTISSRVRQENKMKLYSAPMPAPNPRRVRMVAAEKGIALDEIMLDLRRREHKAADHVARNALGQVPVLVLDDGTAIAETVAICRYLDAIHPEPPLFGRTSIEAALTDMWIRRIEIQIGEPTKMFWRHAHPATASLLTQYNDFGASNQGLMDQAMTWSIASFPMAERSSWAKPSRWPTSPRSPSSISQH
jgi:glutathione S-transferase